MKVRGESFEKIQAVLPVFFYLIGLNVYVW